MWQKYGLLDPGKYLLQRYKQARVYLETYYSGFRLPPQPATFNPQLSTCNFQPATFNPQPATCNPQPATCNSNLNRIFALNTFANFGFWNGLTIIGSHFLVSYGPFPISGFIEQWIQIILIHSLLPEKTPTLLCGSPNSGHICS